MRIEVYADPAPDDKFEVILEGSVSQALLPSCSQDCGPLQMFLTQIGLCLDQLIHSKATMGHGLCSTGAEIQRIIDATQQVIDSRY